ncbi:MAG: NAD(P)-dependent oxidoreductase, partial [Planctomycetota bacterium]
MSKVFITGGTGCIGATAIHQMLQSDDVEKILVASRSSNTELLKMWQGPDLDSRIELVSLDIGDQAATRKAIADFAPTHIVHLGALQSPACDANPQLGMEINVGGTINLFDSAAELDGLERFVFASSAAVYGKRAIYDTPTVPETATLAPPNLYGVWKVAGEHLAALFHEKTGVPTVSLRLNTTYGPGRDQGKTSAPTNALKAIAAGAASGSCIQNRMPYQGRENYHYVEDVGAHFAAVTTMPFEGIGAFNIRGRTIPVSEFLDIAKTVA